MRISDWSSDVCSSDLTDSTIIVTAPQLTSEAEERAAKTAGGVDVVSHRDYADKSIVSLRDTLAFSPGVYVQPRYGQEVRISIRGSGLSRGYHLRGLTLDRKSVVSGKSASVRVGRGGRRSIKKKN